MFWNLLRSAGQFTCYYEPLHEHLLHFIESGSSIVDPSHFAVDNYWSEFEDIPIKTLRNVWRPWFGRSHWYLKDTDTANDLYDFLCTLIDYAQQPAVLKFVRANFRASWLRKHFPNATIIHLVRNPRAVWTSMVGRDFLQKDDDIFFCSSIDKIGFINYMVKAASDMGLQIAGHPYRQFYGLWRKGYYQVDSVANDTWWYEDAVSDIESWFHHHLRQPGWLNELPELPILKGSIKPQLHSDSWYLQQELSVQSNVMTNVKEFTNGNNYQHRLLCHQLQELEDLCLEQQIELDRWKAKYYKKVGLLPVSLVYRIKNYIRARY